MERHTARAILGLTGVFMMLAIAAINSYIAFFAKGEYTGGMLAASAFWVIIGWSFIHASVSESWEKRKEK